MHHRHLITLFAFLPLTVAAQAVDESKLVRLPGNTHIAARPEFDQGPVPDNFFMGHIQLQLKRNPEREAALEQLIDRMHDPNSPNFHKWLTAEEFGGEFGPAPQDIDTVVNWLRGHGFRIGTVYKSGMLIDFAGTAAQVRDAFHTEIHRYNVDGEQYTANAGDPEIPAALEPIVMGPAALYSFHRHAHARRAHLTETFNGITEYYVTPADFAKIYNVTPLWTAGVTGAGQTVAVLEDSDMQMTDWQTFVSSFGLASYGGTFATVHPNCSDPGANGDEIEVAVDAEGVSTFAPGAAVQVAACPSTRTTDGDITAAANLLDLPNPPDVFSDSYGGCEEQTTKSYEALINSTWQQAVAEGVSVFVAAGDEGADECGYGRRYATTGISIDGTASTPYDVAVGGTDFSDVASGTASVYWSATNSATGGSALSYIPEIPWNGTCASNILAAYLGYTSGLDFCNTSVGEGGAYQQVSNAGSGGPSSVFAKPSWQTGVLGIHNDGRRDIPDVSLFASDGVYNQAIVSCMSDANEGGVPCDYKNLKDTFLNSGGGTSCSAPSFAGIQALIDQKVGSRQGNPNPVLYQLAAGEYGGNGSPNRGNLGSCNASNGNTIGGTCIFNDVTEGDNDIPCQAGTPDCYSVAGDQYGVLSTSTTAESIAYGATHGWDFATGLGSVNVTNLVNAWPIPANSSAGRKP
ncbi:MAG TPA: S53 family peptidase [Bryobacteraceae bacterium]|nr:S53 family peptidase [Bryobacteraceae bacterium]